jgi:hypothetical protein
VSTKRVVVAAILVSMLIGACVALLCVLLLVMCLLCSAISPLAAPMPMVTPTRALRPTGTLPAEPTRPLPTRPPVSTPTITPAAARPTSPPAPTTASRPTNTPVPTRSAQSVRTTTPRPCPTALPTSIPPTPTPLPRVVIEAEWPARMEIDQSDYVRVSIVRTTAGEFVPTVEVPGHTVLAATPVPAGTPAVPMERAFGLAYKASAAAKLEGTAFGISPSEMEYQSLDQSRITWDWNILPLKPGSQTINARIVVRWEPIEGEGDAIERTIWRAPLRIVVEEPWIQRGQLSILSLASGMLGSILSAPWLYEKVHARVKKMREKRQREKGNKSKE